MPGGFAAIEGFPVWLPQSVSKNLGSLVMLSAAKHLDPRRAERIGIPWPKAHKGPSILYEGKHMGPLKGIMVSGPDLAMRFQAPSDPNGLQWSDMELGG